MIADGNYEKEKEFEPLGDISNKENVQPTPIAQSTAKGEPPAKRKKVDPGKKVKGGRDKKNKKSKEVKVGYIRKSQQLETRHVIFYFPKSNESSIYFQNCKLK